MSLLTKILTGLNKKEKTIYKVKKKQFRIEGNRYNNDNYRNSNHLNDRKKRENGNENGYEIENGNGKGKKSKFSVRNIILQEEILLPHNQGFWLFSIFSIIGTTYQFDVISLTEVQTSELMQY